MREISLDNYCEMQGKRVQYQAMYERNYGSTRQFLLHLFNGDGSKNIVNVLDYGCGEGGSLGFKGYGHGIVVAAMDADTNNEYAHFHRLEEAPGSYDYVLLSHVIEHMHYPEAVDLLHDCLRHAPVCVIVVPNCGENMFMNQVNYDITHVPEPYNIPDFLFLLELNDIKVNRIIKSNVFTASKVQTFFRTIFSLLVGKSIFYDYIIICEAK